MVDNLLVYRDEDRVTDTNVAWLTPVIEADMDEVTNGLFGTPLNWATWKSAL